MLRVSDPGVMLWSLKPAEEGIDRGVIVRVWNVSDATADTVIEFAPGIASALRTTHIETDLKSADLSDRSIKTRMARQELQTFRIMPTQGEPANSSAR